MIRTRLAAALAAAMLSFPLGVPAAAPGCASSGFEAPDGLTVTHDSASACVMEGGGARMRAERLTKPFARYLHEALGVGRGDLETYLIAAAVSGLSVGPSPARESEMAHAQGGSAHYSEDRRSGRACAAALVVDGEYRHYVVRACGPKEAVRGIPAFREAMAEEPMTTFERLERAKKMLDESIRTKGGGR